MQTTQPAPPASRGWHGGPPPAYQPGFTEAQIADIRPEAGSAEQTGRDHSMLSYIVTRP